MKAAARGAAVRRQAGKNMVSVRARIAAADERARADPSQILGTRCVLARGGPRS